MNSTDCECRVPNSPPTLAEQIDIGVTEDYWYISRMRCSSCGTPWLRAFMEHEAFSRSGRHYRAPVTDAALIDITPEAALTLIENATFKIAGGSYFDGVEIVIAARR
ncbi:hypothetical protein [Ottowia caeni]|uniref:hypothetical protein n=1 Tax=Ottowia caeni TaxID=2870339 RepID=UPI001E2DE742|nr:hypothetical protein [Ottowia caeni]